MNSILESFQHLKRLFSPDFIASLSEESFLYRLLVEQRPGADVWRRHINDCLELAYRYDLVDADLVARLIKGDWESWEAAINELKVAKFIENILGINLLRWRPEGKEGRVGEFEIVLSNLEKPIFVEVKTIFPRDLENLEQRVSDKLRHCIEKVPLPFVLSVGLRNAGQTENFSERYLKKFLVEELGKRSMEDAGKPYKLPDYQERTGLHLEIEAYPDSKRRTCLLGACSFNVRFMNNSEDVKHSLSKACEKIDEEDKRPLLVVLYPSPNYLIDEHDMLNALMGTLQYTISWLSDGSTVDRGPSRKPDGFFQPHRKLSAVGLYLEKFAENSIGKRLEIYHNPFTLKPLNCSLFKGKSVRQLVKKNDEEMEWID